jgi:hypothetical protein
MEGIKKLQYLIESHQAWTPDKLAVLPWETGLTPKCIIEDVIQRTTTQLYVAGIHDRTNDTR